MKGSEGRDSDPSFEFSPPSGLAETNPDKLPMLKSELKSIN